MNGHMSSDMEYSPGNNDSLQLEDLHHGSGSQFCNKDNIAECVRFLYQELSHLGFRVPALATGDGKVTGSSLDVVGLVNILYELVQRQRRTSLLREEVEDRQRRTDADIAHLQQQQIKLKVALEANERELAMKRETERQLLTKNDLLNSRVKMANEENRRLEAMGRDRDTHYKHELRKKEMEAGKLKERLHTVLADRSLKKNTGLDLSHPMTRPDGKRGTWQTVNKQEEEMYRTIIKTYEERQQELMLENTKLRMSLQDTHRELEGCVEPNSPLVMAGEERDRDSDGQDDTESEQLSEAHYQMPYDLVRPDIEKSLREKVKILKNYIRHMETSKSQPVTPSEHQMPWGEASYEGEELSRLNSQIQRYRDVIEQQETLLQQFMESGATSESSVNPDLNFSGLWGERETLENERDLFKRQKENFEQERKSFTEAALRLSKEKKDFESKKLSFLQNQFMQITPFKEDKSSTSVHTDSGSALNQFQSPVMKSGVLHKTSADQLKSSSDVGSPFKPFGAKVIPSPLVNSARASSMEDTWIVTGEINTHTEKTRRSSETRNVTQEHSVGQGKDDSVVNGTDGERVMEREVVSSISMETVGGGLQAGHRDNVSKNTDHVHQPDQSISKAVSESLSTSAVQAETSADVTGSASVQTLVTYSGPGTTQERQDDVEVDMVVHQPPTGGNQPLAGANQPLAGANQPLAGMPQTAEALNLVESRILQVLQNYPQLNLSTGDDARVILSELLSSSGATSKPVQAHVELGPKSKPAQAHAELETSTAETVASSQASVISSVGSAFTPKTPGAKVTPSPGITSQTAPPAAMNGLAPSTPSSGTSRGTPEKSRATSEKSATASKPKRMLPATPSQPQHTPVPNVTGQQHQSKFKIITPRPRSLGVSAHTSEPSLQNSTDEHHPRRFQGNKQGREDRQQPLRPRTSAVAQSNKSHLNSPSQLYRILGLQPPPKGKSTHGNKESQPEGSEADRPVQKPNPARGSPPLLDSSPPSRPSQPVRRASSLRRDRPGVERSPYVSRQYSQERRRESAENLNDDYHDYYLQKPVRQRSLHYETSPYSKSYRAPPSKYYNDETYDVSPEFSPDHHHQGERHGYSSGSSTSRRYSPEKGRYFNTITPRVSSREVRDSDASSQDYYRPMRPKTSHDKGSKPKSPMRAFNTLDGETHHTRRHSETRSRPVEMQRQPVPGRERGDYRSRGSNEDVSSIDSQTHRANSRDRPYRHEGHETRPYEHRSYAWHRTDRGPERTSGREGSARKQERRDRSDAPKYYNV